MGFQLVRVVAIKQQLPRGPEIKARSESCGFMLPVTSASKRPRFVPSPGTRKKHRLFVDGVWGGSGQSVSPSVPCGFSLLGGCGTRKKEREEANGSGGGTSKEGQTRLWVERRMSEGQMRQREREVKAPQSTKASCNIVQLQPQHDGDGDTF